MQAGGFIRRDGIAQVGGRLLPAAEQGERLGHRCFRRGGEVVIEPAVAVVLQQQQTLRGIGGIDFRHRQTAGAELVAARLE